MGVCAGCCRHIQTVVPTPIPCVVRSHRKGVEYSKPEANGTFLIRYMIGTLGPPLRACSAHSNEVSESDAEPRGRRTTRKAPTASKKKTKKTRAHSSGDEGSPGGSDEPTPDRAPPKRDSYATPTNPSYVARVRAMDTENRVVAEQLATRARQAHARSHVKTATLRWWTKVRAGFSLGHRITLIVNDNIGWGIPRRARDRGCEPQCVSA